MLGRTALVAALLGNASAVVAPPPPAVVGGTSPTAFAVAPTVQYHPNSQTATLDGSNKVLDCADLKGLAPLLGLAAIPNNKVRNPNCAGAITGTPGIVPNNWAYATNTTGLTSTVVGTGVENGIPYLDLRVFGTPGSNGVVSVYFDTPTGIAAATAQTWAAAVYARISAGSATNISSQILAIDEITSGGAYVTGGSSSISLTGSLTAFSFARTLNGGATVSFIRPFVRFSVTSGLAIDITLRLGLPDLEQAASATTPTVVGPVQMTDALGRKFWRFSGSHLLTIMPLLVFTKKSHCSLVVARQHRPATTSALLGGQGQSTAMLESNNSSCRAPVPRVFNRARTTVDATYNNLIVGSQLQVIGAASSGTRCLLTTNANDSSEAAVGTDATCTGGFIGGTSSGAQGEWDVYEVAIWNANQTDANFRAQRDLMIANWSIPAVTKQICLVGDSTTYGVTGVDSGSIPSALLGEPGTNRVPDGTRIINLGSGGTTINFGVSDRDAASSWTNLTLAGGADNNKIIFHYGTNDMAAIGGDETAAQVYAETVAYINSASPSGVLQKGWKVYVQMNTAADNAWKAVQIPALRTLYNDPQFLIDTLSNSGNTYDGLVKLINIHLQTVGGNTVFSTQTDAQSLVYYKDGLHPSAAGYAVLVPGGDTPQYGYAAAL
jgi:lysophospholipase L1-like esterase